MEYQSVDCVDVLELLVRLLGRHGFDLTAYSGKRQPLQWRPSFLQVLALTSHSMPDLNLRV